MKMAGKIGVAFLGAAALGILGAWGLHAAAVWRAHYRLMHGQPDSPTNPAAY